MERSTKFIYIGFMTALMTLALMAGLVLVKPAYAVTAAEKQAEAQAALTELNSMQQTLDQASEEYFNSLLAYQQAVEARDSAQTRVDEITSEIADIQGRLGTRVRGMYREGTISDLDLLLGSASFAEFAQNWDLLNRMNETDADLSSRARALRVEAEEQKEECAKQAETAEEYSQKAGEAFQNAQTLVSEMEQIYSSLSSEALQLYAAEAEAAAAAYAAPVEGGYINDDGTVTDVQTGQVYPSAAAYSSATGNEIVDRARAMIGSSYVLGGVGGSDGGFDCSGFVSYALTGSNTRLGTTHTFMNWNEVSTPYVGCVAVNEGHTGIVSQIDADGTIHMVHAINEANGVQETQMSTYGDYKFVQP